MPSQTHAPPTQRCPAPQGAPAPHWQVPAEQVSERLSQAMQAAPAAPQPAGRVPPRQLLPEQQPAHEAGLHTQVPATHCWPLAQAAPEPQAQLPLRQLSATVALQAVQPPPAAPQLEKPGAVQVVPAQHPVGQEVASHTQAPPTQRWPAEQAKLAPQRHSPPAQRSARVSQAAQAAPVAPQLVTSFPVRQVLPEQQPAQEVASQVQVLVPPRQRCPIPQGAAVPHRQVPVTEQLSARIASQATQAFPPTPQVLRPGALQVEPEQQPVRQVPALQPLQAPPKQVWPGGQPWQEPPPAPQAVSRLPGRQAPAEQQPLGQEVLSQMQAPFRQRWPTAHEGPTPHWQAPCAEQLSAFEGWQAAQVAPELPQVVSERTRQLLPSQHPFEQLVESQAQTPPTHRCPAAQAALPPQVHAPPVVQPSALTASQATQALPAAPQLLTEMA